MNIAAGRANGTFWIRIVIIQIRSVAMNSEDIGRITLDTKILARIGMSGDELDIT